MKKEEIHLWDVKRILLGEAPPEFLVEVLIRTIIIYIAAIIVLRWMGKRMNGQLTIIELAVMVMMGAIVSVPMQIPDRGIFQGLLVLLATLFFLRMINWASYRSAKFEDLIQGHVATIVKDGVLQLSELRKNKLSNQQVFMVLRSKNIFNLGRVKRLYMEACGIFSVYEEENDKPGLPIYPPIDENIYETYEQTSNGKHACCKCGYVQDDMQGQCANCGNKEWSKAII
ncbi:MAG TPA: YetF domain-containing protein [Flavisolibacter sp.]|jgi:uncharacterized membrane protein YcaP (DUF421 family)